MSEIEASELAGVVGGFFFRKLTPIVKSEAKALWKPCVSKSMILGTAANTTSVVAGELTDHEKLGIAAAGSAGLATNIVINRVCNAR